MTFNPVTGCLHDCPYCYAKKIAYRFGGYIHFDGCNEFDRKERVGGYGKIHTLTHRDYTPYPYDFDPTFHHYRLNEPQRINKPQNIFVCSMADLFGAWVPDEWIRKVFRACEKTPQHRYIFLTKNPERYTEILKNGCVMKHWFGTTITDDKTQFFFSDRNNAFLSIEPIQSNFNPDTTNLDFIKWVIIGSETGNRKGKIIPKREWIENIVKACRKQNVPVFMKNSLATIWSEPLIREYPWSGLSA
jgi:protein gp37